MLIAGTTKSCCKFYFCNLIESFLSSLSSHSKVIQLVFVYRLSFIQKAHRLLPTNLYVVLYNFKARHSDELDLTAGFKVTVIDTTDPDWWRGKCLGRVGYFPSKYVYRLQANEKPLQVLQNLQISDGDKNGTMTLLRDQIVVQVIIAI